MSRIGDVVFGALGLIELASDAYGWAKRLFSRKKRQHASDLDGTDPIPLRRRACISRYPYLCERCPHRGKTFSFIPLDDCIGDTERLPRPPRVPRI